MADPAYPAPDIQAAARLGVLAPELARARPELRRMLRLGLWRRYGRVVVMHNGPLTAEQLLWVVLLRSPKGVVLSGVTACISRGLKVDPPDQPELLVPAAGPLPDLQGVRAARTRILAAEDVHPTAQPPQLRLPRAIIDAASRRDRPDDVRALLCAGVQQRRVRAQDLREVTERLGPVRHRGLLLRTIDDIEGGAHSVRELQFLRLVRSAGLPPPEQQIVRRHKGGRHYLDAGWEKYALHAEIDGLGHLLVAAWSSDVDRSNELALGARVETRLRIPGFWLDERPQHVVDQLRRGLVKGGWCPESRPDGVINRAA